MIDKLFKELLFEFARCTQKCFDAISLVIFQEVLTPVPSPSGRTSPTASLYVEADEPSLNTRRENFLYNMLLELLKIIQIQLMM